MTSQRYSVTSCSVVYIAAEERREMTCEVAWRSRSDDTTTPDIVRTFARRPGVQKIEWTPVPAK